MAKGSPNPTDKFIGARVRLARTLVGMSQEKLGDKLGISFQQVQKYEKGSNRLTRAFDEQLRRQADPRPTVEAIPLRLIL